MRRGLISVGIVAIGMLATGLAARFATPLTSALVSGVFLIGWAWFAGVQARSLAISQKLAGTDDLTGLANGRMFRDRLVSSKFSSLILFDLDQFKSYNDSFGHVAGDQVLRELGSILPEQPVCYRVGGDEFAMLIDSANLPVVQELAETIRRRILEHPWPNRPVSASFGLAFLSSAIDPTALHDRADRALYQAKSQGGGRICVDSG